MRVREQMLMVALTSGRRSLGAMVVVVRWGCLDYGSRGRGMVGGYIGKESWCEFWKIEGGGVFI